MTLVNENKLVSVLMSTYNEKGEYLSQAIDSILNQTYKNIEFIIIIDNPNNEEIINLVASYKNKDKRIKVIKNDINLGLVKSLNKGIKHCKGYYIARMDADDISEIDRIEIQVRYLQENPDIHLVGSGIEFIDENNDKIDMQARLIKDKDTIKNILKFKNCMAHPTWVIKSDVFKDKNIKEYREIPYAEDYDLICRLVANNYNVGNINKNLVKYRLRQEGISISNSYKQLISSKYVRDLYRYNLKYKKDKYSEQELNKLLNKQSKTYDNYNNLLLKSRIENNKFYKLIYKVASKTISMFDQYTRKDFADEISCKLINILYNK